MHLNSHHRRVGKSFAYWDIEKVATPFVLTFWVLLPQSFRSASSQCWLGLSRTYYRWHRLSTPGILDISALMNFVGGGGLFLSFCLLVVMDLVAGFTIFLAGASSLSGHPVTGAVWMWDGRNILEKFTVFLAVDANSYDLSIVKNSQCVVFQVPIHATSQGYILYPKW